MTLRFLLIDDDHLFLSGLKSYLQPEFPDAELTFAHSEQEVMQLLQPSSFDLALMDLQLRDGSSTNHMMHCLHETGIKTLIISGTASNAQLRMLPGSGALGYYDKLWPIEQLYASMRAILAGQVGFPRELFDVLIKKHTGGLPALESEEERKLLALFICDHGRSNKHLAILMEKSEPWVKAKLRSICLQFDVSNREQLTELLKQHHLILEQDLSAVRTRLENLFAPAVGLD